MKMLGRCTRYCRVLTLCLLTLGVGWTTVHAEDVVNVLSSSGDSQKYARLFAEFEKTTGIHVNATHRSLDLIVDQLIAEKDHPQVDVAFGSAAIVSAQLRKDLFEPYKPPAYEVLDARCKDPEKEGYWVGYAEEPLVFVSNKAFLKEHNLAPPSSWQDLLDPVYKGMI